MHIKNAKAIQGYQSDHGEIVQEMIGASAGGTNAYSLAQITLPPGKSALKHYHPVAQESYYILSGIGRMELDDETRMVSAGDTIAILPHQVHRIVNSGTDDLVLLAVCVPAWTPDNSVFLD